MEGSQWAGATRALAALSGAMDFAALPADAQEIARQCVLDWLGVAVAGTREPSTEILLKILLGQGGSGACTVLGRAERLSPLNAAMVNGAAAHALDFDDANLVMTGHPSVVVLSALLALAEERRLSGNLFMTAFVAGYEAGCRLGAAIGESHYVKGFHNSATLGTIASAIACARLIGLDVDRTAHAIALAATQAAGLRAMFGTMVKPLHAGFANSRGLLAALLAEAGMEGVHDALEAPRGFFDTHSEDGDLARLFVEPPRGYYLREGLFKYHASCFLTHAPAEAVAKLVLDHGIKAAEVEQLTLTLHPAVDTVCNIVEPVDGLGMKFSVRAVSALALTNMDTASPHSFSAAMARDPEQVALRSRIVTQFAQMRRDTACIAELQLKDGRCFRAEFDAGEPQTDLSAQRSRLEAKLSCTAAVMSDPARMNLTALVDKVQDLADAGDLARLCTIKENI